MSQVSMTVSSAEVNFFENVGKTVMKASINIEKYEKAALADCKCLVKRMRTNC